MRRYRVSVVLSALVGLGFLLCTYMSFAEELQFIGTQPMDTWSGWGIRDLTWDGEYLWGIDDSPICKINPATFKIENCLPQSIILVKGLAYGQGYLWITRHGGILAVDRNGNMDDSKTIGFDIEFVQQYYGYDNISGGCWDGQSLWFITNWLPCLALHKVDVNKKEVVKSINLFHYFEGYDLVYVNGSLWVLALHGKTLTENLVKVNPDSGEVIETHPVQPSSTPTGIAYDGNHLILADPFKMQYYLYQLSPTMPEPDIQINGSDGSITLNQSDTLSITVALDNKSITDNADWWLAADTPFGLWFYTFEGWRDDWMPVYQGPLFYLNSFEVLKNMPVSGLLAGTYTLYFGVDTVMDGNVTWDSLYYETIVVNVTE